MKLRMLAATSLLLVGVLPAQAQRDAELVYRYCRGMLLNYKMPDHTRADCISETHAIEVERSDRWAEALGQALHYAYWTREIAANPRDYPQWSGKIDKPRKAGIVLVCLRKRDRQNPYDTCNEHYVRLFRIIEEYKLPVTIWDCNLGGNPMDNTLDACLKIDMPKQTAQP